jgi:hypothetical protein
MNNSKPVIDRIEALLKPKSEEMPKLLNLLMNQPQSYLPPKPSGQVMPTAEATPENIAASIAEPAPKQSIWARFPFVRQK